MICKYKTKMDVLRFLIIEAYLRYILKSCQPRQKIESESISFGDNQSPFIDLKERVISVRDRN